MQKTMENGFAQLKAFIKENLNENCEKCTDNRRIVLFEPLTDKCEEVGIVFLGLSPGAAEFEAGHPFASEEDQLCRKMFCELGLTKYGILLFNACCCVHTPDLPPTEKEIYYCFDNFEKALELIPQEAIIVPTGAPSLRRMGITESPGEAMEKIYMYENHRVLPMVHISSVTKGEVSMERFVSRLEQVRDLYVSKEMPEVPECRIHDGEEVKESLMKEKVKHR